MDSTAAMVPLETRDLLALPDLLDLAVTVARAEARVLPARPEAMELPVPMASLARKDRRESRACLEQLDATVSTASTQLAVTVVLLVCPVTLETTGLRVPKVSVELMALLAHLVRRDSMVVPDRLESTELSEARDSRDWRAQLDLWDRLAALAPREPREPLAMTATLGPRVWLDKLATVALPVLPGVMGSRELWALKGLLEATPFTAPTALRALREASA